MKSRTISIYIGICLIIAIGAIVYTTKKPVEIPVDTSVKSQQELTPATVTATSTTSQPVASPTPAGITLSQVAEHNSRTSCWSAINGSVYDLTSWIPNHPGGERGILSMCGTDGSQGYNKKHGGEAKPARMLGGFKIGALAQ